jgi:hypothetical protein
MMMILAVVFPMPGLRAPVGVIEIELAGVTVDHQSAES